MFAVSFSWSCLDSRKNSIGKKFDWEKAVYQLLFMPASTLYTLKYWGSI